MQKLILDHRNESVVECSAGNGTSAYASPPIKAKSPLQKSGQKDCERQRWGEQSKIVSSEHDKIAILINWNQLWWLQGRLIIPNSWRAVASWWLLQDVESVLRVWSLVGSSLSSLWVCGQFKLDLVGYFIFKWDCKAGQRYKEMDLRGVRLGEE